MTPVCYDCLSANVAVKVIDQCGFEHWFCAEHWEANERFHAALMKMLEQASDALAQ